MMLALLACDSVTDRRTDYAVHGIDVSHYQSYIDWPSIARQDIDFAFVKASEGVSLRDSLFCDNWEGMQAAGILRGAYHFYRPRVSAIEQALNFFRVVNMNVGDLPPVLDVEVLDGATKAELIVGIKTWLWMAELHYGIKPILYTNIKFYNKYLAGHFDEFPLWIARYNSREPTLACGGKWQIWQYGNRGRVEGIEGDVDLNVFHGTREELERLCLQPRAVISEDRLAIH